MCNTHLAHYFIVVTPTLRLSDKNILSYDLVTKDCYYYGNCHGHDLQMN